jgi:hypothetical protein
MLGLQAKEHPFGVTTCLTGTIVRTGCGEELICLDVSVPYALRLDGSGTSVFHPSRP